MQHSICNWDSSVLHKTSETPSVLMEISALVCYFLCLVFNILLNHSSFDYPGCILDSVHCLFSRPGPGKSSTP